MPKHLRIKGRELVAASNRTGFVVIRIKGSHSVIQHKDGRTSVLPVHSVENFEPGLLGKTMFDANTRPEDLRELL